MNNKFILMNTQRGKTACTISIVKEFTSNDPTYIPLFILDNNTSLAIQYQNNVAGLGHVFALHSLGNTSMQDILAYIRVYSPDTQILPCIMALCNRYQIPRLTKIMKYIMSLGFKPLLIVDEADKTYPHVRDELYTDFEARLPIATVFVSATIGDLHKYEECVSATVVSNQIDDAYCGLVTQQYARTKEYVIDGCKEESAIQCIRDNREYFFSRVVGRDGQMRHRKVLIHGSTILRMTRLACVLAQEGWGVVCVTGPGTFAVKDGHVLGGVKNRRISVSKSVAALCAEYDLCGDRPLAVIGNRKMDRGITYHSWDDGLIFTDCLIGNVKKTDTAVQKAGRLAGNIALRPEFIGIATWWSNANTLDRIIRQNQIIMMSQPLKPVSVLLFNTYIYGPFKHKYQLRQFAFLRNIQGKLRIQKGATFIKHAYNASLNQCLALNTHTHIFAAKINQLYFIFNFQP